MTDPTAHAAKAAHNVDDVRTKVRDLIADLAPEPMENMPDGASLVDDMAFHSLALLELAFNLEDEFDLEPLEEETASKISTVEDVITHVLGELGLHQL